MYVKIKLTQLTAEHDDGQTNLTTEVKFIIISVN